MKTRSLPPMLACAVILFAAATPSITAAATPAGHWAGAVELPNGKLPIRIDLATAGDAGAWSGTIDIPAQGLRGFGLSDVAVDALQVSFRMPDIPGDPVFRGTLADGGERITGQLSQSGHTFPFTLERSTAPLEQLPETPERGVPGEGLVGHWQGSLRQGPMELRLVLHVQPGDDGALGATIDSLDQGAKGIPVSKVNFSDGKTSLELTTIRATYEGELVADGSEITGRWKQGPLDAPLVFRRLAAPPE